MAYRNRRALYREAMRLDRTPYPEWQMRNGVAGYLEWELPQKNGAIWYADLGLGPSGADYLFEIKSHREEQSASDWTRQVRKYERSSGLTCFLVVAHPLGEVQVEYLKLSRVQVIDLRTLPEELSETR